MDSKNEVLLYVFLLSFSLGLMKYINSKKIISLSWVADM